MNFLKTASIGALVVLIGFGSTVAVSALTATTTISSVISSVISITNDYATVNVDVYPSGVGSQTISFDNVKVSTNNPAGYNLQIAATTTNTALVGTNVPSNTILTSSGTVASPIALNNNTWGFRVDGLGGFGAGPTSSVSNVTTTSTKFAGIPSSASPVTLKTTSGMATNDATKVWYSVAADTNQAADTYTNTVTYTAVTN